MPTRIALLLIATLLLSACAGKARSLTPSVSDTSSQSQAEEASAGADAMGAPAKNVSDLDSELNSPVSAQISRAGVVHGLAVALGSCHSGEEFLAPDTNNDANSTETKYFYDSACTELARDIVRKYTSTGAGSETVNRTMQLFAPLSSVAEAVRTDAVSMNQAQFDQYGFPIAATGYARIAVGQLALSGVNTIASDDELVMVPSSGTSNAFCMDSAGFNVAGIASLSETTGWQGGAFTGGTRTVNSNGTIVYTATHIGSDFKGAIGSLSIATGTQNTACPITTPRFTLAGGTLTYSYDIPLSITYLHGVITNITITNATLSNSDVLNVTTNAALAPSNADFISGSIASSTGTVIATFSTDAFGDGSLAVNSSGDQFNINDWHVIR